MAEFCPVCWNEINDFDDPPEAYILSWGYELCEGCGEHKRVVVGERRCMLIILLCKLWNKLKSRR